MDPDRNIPTTLEEVLDPEWLSVALNDIGVTTASSPSKRRLVARHWLRKCGSASP